MTDQLLNILHRGYCTLLEAQNDPSSDRSLLKFKMFSSTAKDWLNPSKKAGPPRPKGPRIYLIVGYEPQRELGEPVSSEYFGYCSTVAEAQRAIRALKNKYLPKKLSFSLADTIKWRYGNDIEAFIRDADSSGTPLSEADKQVYRDDWAKYNGSSLRLSYDKFDYRLLDKFSPDNI